MLRRSAVCLIVLTALVPVPAAAADGGPLPGLLQGWTGVSAPNLPLRYVTLTAPEVTTLVSVRKSDGRVQNWTSLKGYLGIPMVAGDGTAGGLTRDGRVLVLPKWDPPLKGPLRSVSTFKLVNTRTLRVWRTVALKGDFVFDALSPGGGTLYLIQHVSNADATRYLVRAYDIASKRLLPQVIADRRQEGWVMRGYPLRRATSADGRWVYTLYQQSGGYPFVHALDAVSKTAVCVGIPWTGSQQRLPTARLRLDERHGTLTVLGPAGREYAIDTRTFRVSLPRRGGGGFPAGLVAGPGGAVAALALLGLVVRRRRSSGRGERPLQPVAQ
jgi:hypothetical protein